MIGYKILLIDDDDDFSEGMSLALDIEGYEVTVASNGTEGIAATREAVFDFILCDIGLPDLNGVETLIQIRQFNPDAHCFLLTGYSAVDLMEQGISAGALEILTKPVNIEKLLQKLTNLMA
jgi:DNA-binding response OmpR family regulator